MSPLATVLLLSWPVQDTGVPAVPQDELTEEEVEQLQGSDVVEETEIPAGSYLGSLKTIYADGQVDITWGGRLEIDWGWFTVDDDYPDDGEDGVEVPRLRLFAEGYVYEESLFAKADFDFARGNVSIFDLFLSWDSKLARVQVGNFKEPTTLDNQISGHQLTFLERGLPVTTFTTLRSTGVMVSNVTAKNLHWNIGAFYDSNNSGVANDGDGPIFAARVVLPLRWRIDRVFHLGAWASARPDDDGFVRFRSRPEAHLISRVLDTGEIPAEGVVTYGGEFAWTYGPYSLQAEYVKADVDATGIEDPSFDGWYAYASWFLTGESRNYRPLRAAFGRVRPTTDFSTGLTGAWELAARYSTTDLDDGPSGDKLDNVTLGLNWHMNQNSHIALNYLFSSYEDGLTGDEGDLHGLMVRFHVDW